MGVLPEADTQGMTARDGILSHHPTDSTNTSPGERFQYPTEPSLTLPTDSRPTTPRLRPPPPITICSARGCMLVGMGTAG